MKKTNILLILNDDMGYSDLGCYGGEIETPNLDRLAQGGLRYTQFYNTARCCPSRASLLTGLHPHQADVGHMVGNDDVDGYLGDLSKNAATLAEVLQGNGYATMMSGKWHVTGRMEPGEEDNWPCQRGFETYYGMLGGAGSYFDPHRLMQDNTPLPTPKGDFYFTDAISENASKQLNNHFQRMDDRPFFQYIAYTAPHWPLHARKEDIAKYKGRYDAGWDALRDERLERIQSIGLSDTFSELSARDPESQPWDDAPDKNWESQRMEVYAAQIDRMDQGIGQILDTLESAGELENTLIIFLADNGGCAEELTDPEGRWLIDHKSAREFTRDGRRVRFGRSPDIIPGLEDTYTSYGISWANASNTPFRKFKSWIHEGGISTPFIAHWPAGIEARGEFREQPAQLPDVMATLLEVTGSRYPEQIGDRAIQPHEGFSMVPTFTDEAHARETLIWEHEGNCGIRRGQWKLVREHGDPWELYDIEADRIEMNDLFDQHPETVAALESEWTSWARRCNVQPWDAILKKRYG